MIGYGMVSALIRLLKKSPHPLSGGEGIKQAADFIGPHPSPLPEGEGTKGVFQQPVMGGKN